MARRCDILGKQTVAGKSRGHKRGKAGGVSGPWSKKATATNRVFRPNLVRNVRVIVDGKPTRMTLSTKAIKRMRNFGSLRGVTLAS